MSVDERAIGSLIEESSDLHRDCHAARRTRRWTSWSIAGREDATDSSREATFRAPNGARSSATGIGGGKGARGTRRRWRTARAHGPARVRGPNRRRADAADRDIDRDPRDRDLRRGARVFRSRGRCRRSCRPSPRPRSNSTWITCRRSARRCEPLSGTAADRSPIRCCSTSSTRPSPELTGPGAARRSRDHARDGCGRDLRRLRHDA